MIDIRHLRERPGLYRENMKKKGQNPGLVDSVLKMDEEWRAVKAEADKLRAERNKVSESINQAKKKGQDAKGLIARAREIPGRLKVLEEQEADSGSRMQKYLYEIPNLMHPKVPAGKSAKDNKVIKTVGKPTRLAFPAKNHVQLIEALDLGKKIWGF